MVSIGKSHLASAYNSLISLYYSGLAPVLIAGNGVENAFAYTKAVFTLSFHQFCPGFFPGSGSAADSGVGPGRGYCANFPYKGYIHGELFIKYFLM